MAACIAWHFHEIDSVLQFRTDRFSTPMAPASEIIYDTLRELALVQPQMSATGGAFLDELAGEQEIFKIILTVPPAAHHSHGVVVLVLLCFYQRAVKS